jgi:hypothetical protein
MAAAGLAELEGELAGLVGGLLAAGPGLTLEALEKRVVAGGRELLRKVAQLVLDVAAAGEDRLAAVAGPDGPRTRSETGQPRTVVTRLGKLVITRIAYRAPKLPNLHPRDAALNLPPRRYSWPLQLTVIRHALAGSYEQAGEFVEAITGVKIGKQQLEQIVTEAARDAPRFYQDQARAGGQAPGQERGPASGPGQGQREPPVLPLALSADGKGVAMRPEARRRTAKAPEDRVRNYDRRRGTGEKGCKRMAEVGAVFDVAPPPPGTPPRTPEQVMRCEPGQDGPPPAPRAVNRWYTIGITADRAATISAVFDQAERRDPGHARPWIALADGDLHQIRLIQDQAAARGIPVTILIDLIHVLEYLWKAGWCFHRPRDPAIETWVTAQALDILHGRVTDVIARIRQLADDHPPQGSEHTKIIRKTLHYLTAKQPYLDYPAALKQGWPIATGVIEGACRHLVQDRMGITGARWGLEGAQAILWLRAIHANGDLDAYWDYHIQQEHQRNHLSRYKTGLTLAA